MFTLIVIFTTNKINSALNQLQWYTHNLQSKALSMRLSYAIHAINPFNTFLEFGILNGNASTCIHHITNLQQMILNLLWDVSELYITGFSRSETNKWLYVLRLTKYHNLQISSDSLYCKRKFHCIAGHRNCNSSPNIHNTAFWKLAFRGSPRSLLQLDRHKSQCRYGENRDE